MPVESLFATLVYRARVRHRGLAALNADLLRECRQLRIDDAAGRRWSRSHYPGGYTSYGSVNRLHRLSPTFAQLRDLITPHVTAFVRKLRLDVASRPLEMTDCWANIMPRGLSHGWHLHPLSTISGTYYVQTPPGAAGIKFEDPRLDRMMAAPPRRARVPRAARIWVSLPARAGNLVLFESWLRHEVPPHPVRAQRVSISFNYGWF
jgi:uncharacterized protein (TIGR02466 family)